MLIAKSGLRKGYPVKQAQRLVENLEVMKVISGRNSIQSILTELSKQWTLETGKILRNAQAFIVNDELDSLLIGDPQAQTILTALYDSFYHKKWQNTLKKDGREILNELYITMLTATNPEHLSHFLDKTSAKGGFLGRTMMIYEDKKSKINPLVEENDATEIDTSELLVTLKQISELKGQVSFTKISVAHYKQWYKSFYEKLETGEISDESGTAERAGDAVLKLAMILALDQLSMVVEKEHIDRAIDLFYDAARSSKRVLAGAGSSENSEKVKTILGYLLSKPGYCAYKRQILAAKYGDIDTNDLAKVVDTLDQAGIIEVLIDKNDGPLYKITDKYAKEFKSRIGDI
jgi:DNA-binding MarR family transcriptional regulator